MRKRNKDYIIYFSVVVTICFFLWLTLEKTDDIDSDLQITIYDEDWIVLSSEDYSLQSFNQLTQAIAADAQIKYLHPNTINAIRDIRSRYIEITLFVTNTGNIPLDFEVSMAEFKGLYTNQTYQVTKDVGAS